MRCLSCQEEINPKFRHSIEQNICPYCGGSVMEELLKSLLIVLQDTMNKLQAYPDQLNDWLLSNFNYIKTDNPNLKTYLPKETLKEMKKELDDEDFDRRKKVIKVKTEQGEVEVVTEKIQSDTKTAGFFERAQLVKKGTGDDDGDMDPGNDVEDEVELQPVKVTKPKVFKTAAERTEHYKNLKKKVQITAGTHVNQEGLAAMIDPSVEADPEDVAAYGSLLSDGDIITSALPPSMDDEDGMTDRILSANLAIKGQGKSKGSGHNEADLRALREMHAKVNVSRKNFEQGENRGKNGFSRS